MSASQTAAEYSAILQIWNGTVKPELLTITAQAPRAWQDLYFVNIFDRFCHFLIVEVDKQGLAGHFPRIGRQNAQERMRQFASFVARYIPHDPEQARIDQLLFAHQFARRHPNYPQVPPPTEQATRQFFLDMNSVSYGSGAGVRMRAVREAPIQHLADLLTCAETIRDNGVQQTIQRLLTPRPKGVKLNNLGPACTSEIPGWLLIDETNAYPIVNGKFVKTLERLGLYDAASTNYPGS